MVFDWAEKDGDTLVGELLYMRQLKFNIYYMRDSARYNLFQFLIALRHSPPNYPETICEPSQSLATYNIVLFEISTY